MDHPPSLTHAERQMEWNNTHVPFPEDACLHHFLEARAQQSPDSIALIFKDQQLTYGELNRRSNQLAHYLQSLGVGPDVPVAIFIERSLEMAIGLYGVLKAGGVYVPVDPNYPGTRVAFMIEDTRVPVILTQESLLDTLPTDATHPPHQARVVAIDADWEKISRESEENPKTDVTANHLAYTIYTSGSTGQPKGAMLNHRGRVNNFLDFNRRYDIGPDDRLLGLASLSFDMSAYDIFGMMATGGRTIIVEKEAVLNPARWAELMVEHKITVWHSVPALLEMLVNQIEPRPSQVPHSLRLVLLGGDWIPVTLPDRLKALIEGVHTVSMGGATEVSMDSTIYDIVDPSSEWKSIPYGVPMANQL
ncbi:MAG: AMP-binding protein, partial [Anaerolineales bacterium]